MTSIEMPGYFSVVPSEQCLSTYSKIEMLCWNYQTLASRLTALSEFGI
jgi:hypothetical protein